jgi:tetratricopeptide (TPR) repeat protein
VHLECSKCTLGSDPDLAFSKSRGPLRLEAYGCRPNILVEVCPSTFAQRQNSHSVRSGFQENLNRELQLRGAIINRHSSYSASFDSGHIAEERGAKAMSIRVAICIFLCGAAWTSAQAQTTIDDPDVLLKNALHLGDLYNWADAAPLFAAAEQLYAARGDNRDVLFAHLGQIRSTMEQLSLPAVSEELGTELDKNPLLQSDKELRLFCLMVLGDIDGELDAAPMRRDWEAALKLAQDLGDKKLENRASGELGFALFLEGDMTSARQKVAGALVGAMMFGDIGAQIRYLAAVGHAYVQLGSYDDALGYFDKALKIAAANPDAGWVNST